MTKKRRLIYELNTARHCMMKSLDSGCIAALGVSATQLSALMALREKNGMLMKDLAHTLMLDKSAVTGLAKRMQANGLIERTASETDSRAALLNVTEEGQKILSKGLVHLQKVNEQIIGDFTEEEIATVSRFFTHITKTFR